MATNEQRKEWKRIGLCSCCGKRRPVDEGMFHRYENKKRVNISVKLVNYKNLTGIEAWNILSGKVISESMILDAWNKLGLRLGFMTPILKDLN